MSNVKLIAINSLISTGGSVLSRIFEFVILMMLTRYLSVDGVGIYMAIFAYVGYISIFIDSGLLAILRRECSADRDNYSEHIGNSLSITIIVTMIITAIGYVILKYSGYPDAVRALYVFAVPTLITSSRYVSMRKILEVMFIVDFKVHYNVIFVLLDRLLLLVCIFWFIRNSHSPMHAVWITVAVEVISFIFMLGTYIKKYGLPKLNLQLDKWKYLLSQSLPSLMVSLSHVTIFKGGLLLLSAFGTTADVAMYGIASRIPFMINFIPTAFIDPIMVVLSKKFHLNKDAFFGVFSFLSRYLFFIAFPFLLLIFLEADELFSLVFPDSYKPAIPVIRVLIITEIFAWGLLAFINGLVAGCQQVTSFKIVGQSALLCVILNLFFIPTWGSVGAAYATFFGTSSFMIIGLFQKISRPYIIIIFKSLWRPALAGIFMIGVLYPWNTNIWISSVTGPILFFGVLYLIKGFNQRDLGFILEIFPKNKLLNLLKK